MANAWMTHLTNYWNNNKHTGMSYKQAMQNAKKTYTSSPSTMSSDPKKKSRPVRTSKSKSSAPSKVKKTKKKTKRSPNAWMKHLSSYWSKNKGKVSYKQAMINAKKTYKK
jgi:hypothetical protein|tara:strand:- start:207 stop:536 length:330 start_codon:yes stop_codon:yes gene_type:complete